MYAYKKKRCNMKEVLTAVEENTLCSRFGLIDELSDEELESIDGGIKYIDPKIPDPIGGGPLSY